MNDFQPPTAEGFRTWLELMSPGHTVGWANSGGHCPIATYTQDLNGVEWCIVSQNSVNGPAGEGFNGGNHRVPLAAALKHFIFRLDTFHSGPVTAATALTVLDTVELLRSPEPLQKPRHLFAWWHRLWNWRS